METKVQEIEQNIKTAHDAATEAKNAATEAKNAAEELKKEMADNAAEMEKKFNNIDDTLKEMSQKLEEKKEMEQKGFVEAFKDIIESDEFKSKLNEVKERKLQGFTQEIKLATTDLTGDVNRTEQNTAIYGPSFAALSFFNRVPRYTVSADKNRFMWVDASFADNTGYVGEGQENTNKNTATAVEKYREVAKIGNGLEFTAETATDMSYFLNWVRNQSRNAIISKVDTLMWNGDGADGGAKAKNIYGIKGAATAFNANKAGLATAIENADSRALLLAMKAQIEKETNGAYVPNIVYMSTEDLVKFINLRDANGNQLNFPDFQTALGCQIVSSPKLASGEILMADINAIQLHEKQGFEMEVERKAGSDSYVMWLRWRGNVAIPAEAAKAVVYVANAETAINAIKKA